MTRDDSIAEKLQQYDGQALADYLPVALPCYLLQVDAVVIERRKLMPVEEYLLRAIDAGLVVRDEAARFLGLSGRYADQLIEQLDDQEYVAVVDDDTVRIRPKGREVLALECERRPAERSISVVWDPVKEAPLTSWFDLLGQAEVRRETRLVVVPRSLRLPQPEEIPIGDIQASRRTGRIADRENAEEIVRFLEIRRRTLRYRQGTLLAYSTGDSRPPLIKIALEGLIDEDYSQAFARHGLPAKVGIDHQFSRRQGVAGVRQRVQALGGRTETLGSYGELIRRRSVLRLGLEVLERQQEEEQSPERASRIAERLKALAEVEEGLATWPIRQLMPFEIPQIMQSALETAKLRILVTTTMPNETRFSNSVAALLEGALRRGVTVAILIAGRPRLDWEDRQVRQWSPIRELNALARKYRNLQVGFLKDLAKNVFEVSVDDELLAISNEPSLGSRAREPLSRCFSGYLLLNQSQIRSYVASHLQGDKVAVIEKLRLKKETANNLTATSSGRPNRQTNKNRAAPSSRRGIRKK